MPKAIILICTSVTLYFHSNIQDLRVRTTKGHKQLPRLLVFLDLWLLKSMFICCLTLQREKILSCLSFHHYKYFSSSNIGLGRHVNVLAQVRIESIKANIWVSRGVCFLDVYQVPYKARQKSLLLFEKTAGGEKKHPVFLTPYY